MKGPNVALGYYNNEQATRETFIGEWLRTGDTFRATKEGLLLYVPRRGRVVRSLC